LQLLKAAHFRLLFAGRPDHSFIIDLNSYRPTLSAIAQRRYEARDLQKPIIAITKVDLLQRIHFRY